MRFSEVPHFILKTFIDRSHDLKDTDNYYGTDTQLINPDFIFKDRSEKHYWENTDTFTWSGIENDVWFTDSYLWGPRTTIVAKEEGVFLELYIEDSDGIFNPIKLQTKKSDITHNKFGVTHILDYNKSSDLKETIDEEHHDEEGEPYLSYEFKIYDIWDQEVDIENGTSLYFRKDSIFHDWIKKQAPDVLEDRFAVNFILDYYLNTEKRYIYLGDLYLKQDNKYEIIFFNIKHFVENSIPEHQRTEKLKDFLYLAFDILYNEVYQTQKQMWSQIDPIEANEDLLSSIGQYYGINLNLLDFNIERKRRFIKYLPDLIKSKGTYTSLYHIWYVLTETQNRLNVYERWHDKEIEGDISESDYTDWLYTSFYKNVDDDGYIIDSKTDFESGTGEKWYKEYFDDSGYDSNVLDDKTLSTMYIVESDLSTEPIEKNSILNKETANALYTLWEEFRPIIRVSDYKMLISPISDLTGQYNNLYSEDYIPELKTKTTIPVEVSEGAHVSFATFVSGDNIIEHNLGTENVFVNIYDEDFNSVDKELVESVKIVDENNIEVVLSKSKKYYIFVKRADDCYEVDPLGENEYRHSFDSEEIISQLFLDSSVIYQDSQKIKSGNKLEIEDTFDRWTLTSSEVKVNFDNKTSEEELIVQYYLNDELVYPNEESTDYNRTVVVSPETVIHQETPQSTWNISHEIGTEDLIIQVYDEDNNFIKPKNIQIVDNENIQIDFDTSIIGKVLLSSGKSSDLIESDDITYEHIELSTDLIVQLFDENKQMLIPEKVEFINDQKIRIKNDSVVKFYISYKEQNVETPDSIILGHYLDKKFVLVDVYNENNEKIKQPDYEVLDSNRIELNTQDKGYALIKGVGNLGFSPYLPNTYIDFIQDSNFIIEHNLETKDVFVVLYDENFNIVRPDTITTINENQVEIDVGEEKQLYTIIYQAPFVRSYFLLRQYYDNNNFISPINYNEGEDYKIVREEPEEVLIQDNESSEWTIEHNLSTENIIIDLYELDNIRFDWSIVDDIEIVDENTVKIYLTESSTGIAMVTSGDVREEIEIDRNILRQYYIDNKLLYPEDTKDTDISRKYNNIVVEEPEYEHIQDTESSIWDVEHNLGSKNLIIDVYDSENRKINPNKITIVDDNNVEVEFDENITGKVYILKQGIVSDLEEGSEVTYDHGLNSVDIMVQTFDTNYEMYSPDEVEIIDENNIKIINSENVQFYINVKKQEGQYNIGDEHYIEHNLDTSDILIQTHTNNNVYYPEVEIVDENTVKITNEEEIDFNINIKEQKYVYVEYDDNIIYQFALYDDISPLGIKPLTYERAMLMTPDVRVDIFKYSDTWTIEHDLGVFGVIVDIFDDDMNRLDYENIQIIDKNTIKVYFSEPQVGQAIVSAFFEWDIQEDDNTYIDYVDGQLNSVNHNLNTDRVLVHVYDSLYNRIYPNNINIIDDNNVEIEFDDSILKYIIVKGLEVGSEEYINNYGWVISGFADTKKWMVQSYQEDKLLYEIEDDIWKVDSTRIAIESDQTNKICLYQVEKARDITTPSTQWDINHEYGRKGVIVDYFDHNGYKLDDKINYVQLVDDNKCTLNFNSEVYGYALITEIGNVKEPLIVDKLSESSLYISSESDDMETYDHIFDLERIREESENIYVEYKIPKNIELNIKEMAIYSKEDETLFYTECSDLYKHGEFVMNVFFRIKREYNIV